MRSDPTQRIKEQLDGDLSATSALGEEIRHRVSSEDFEWATLLGAELARRAAHEGEDSSELAFLLDRLQTALATTAGQRSLRALLCLPSSLRAGEPAQARAERRLAQMVATGHRPADIVPVVYGEQLGTAASDEFKACLLQELVLEGVAVPEYPLLRSFGEALVTEDHPLAPLPLHLLPTERALLRPTPAPHDWTWALPPASVEKHSGQPEVRVSPEMRRRSVAVDPAEITDPEVAEAMSAAVRHWLEESNGMVAAQEFWSASAVSPDDFAAVFERLPLTAWPTGETRARLHPASSDRVLQVLLTTAVRSPAYGNGMFGAYGRLAAWRSLGGLVGAAPDAPISHTATLVEQAHWFIADPSSDWFHQVAWDLAVAALRPGGQDIAVLTATDTD
ncbi:hypothetical protein SAMN04487983_102946 [Streptomyces sp. yr375]|uniref:DUF6183 family protein n=1 Tax=Streptomyces sp. yr375 TaxID=1761906 RepID=UPI0008ADE5EC|nr:DUF6183 family protein [Streptomyces sp. yr375]SES05443.1 hypothetical protein SAMN04487983_102946 [Streptomyces sp. yr375]